MAELYRDVVTARIEYAFIRADNGVPDLGMPDVPLEANELLAQLELRF
jgi:hypothetical protein